MEEKVKPKKKRRYKVLFTAGVLAAVMGAGALTYTNIPEVQGAVDNFATAYLPFLSNAKQSIIDIDGTQVALPLDESGIVSITYPGVNRNLAEEKGFYSLPEYYTAYVVNRDNKLAKANLTPISNSTKNGVNVINYECRGGNPPASFIGIQNEYAKFVDKMIACMEKIAKRDPKYTSPLVEVNYEVEDLYELEAGYVLYCTDASLAANGRLAYVAANGKQVFSIPRQYINSFVGITQETYDLIQLFTALESQIVAMNSIYFEQEGQNDTRSNYPTR